MIRKVLPRSVIGLLAAAALGAVGATPVLAYGTENYQVGFAGTAVAPAGGFSFGFWGWCAFGGGNAFTSAGLAVSGTTGDCQLAEYVHGTSGVTCHQSADLTSWAIEPSFIGFTFHGSGTATVDPADATFGCLNIPGAIPSSFTDFDTMIPGAPGHYNLNGVLGLTGELQVQVTAI